MLHAVVDAVVSLNEAASDVSPCQLGQAHSCRLPNNSRMTDYLIMCS